MVNKVEIASVNTSQLPVLTNKEKDELFIKIKQGDEEARTEFIKGNLRLVLSVIQRFYGRGENADDLFQIGCIGLIKSIDNFDLSQGVQFSTYAVPMIIGEVRRYLRDNNSIRVSRSVRDLAYKAIQYKERYTKEFGKEPTIDEIAKELGKKLVIKDIAFDSIVNEVKSGKADFAAAGISYSDERAKEVDFTVNYATSKQVVIVTEDSDISLPEQIKDKRIAVQLGSIADTYVTENYKDATITRQKKYLAAIQDLKTGKVDCVVMDELPAQEILKENSGLKILDKELTQDKYGMIVKKGNKELLDSINKVLNRLISEGKISEYVIKHTGE